MRSDCPNSKRSDERAKAMLQSAGASVPLPALPLPPPVTAQLHNTANHRCWATTFQAAEIAKNAAGQFKATAD